MTGGKIIKFPNKDGCSHPGLKGVSFKLTTRPVSLKGVSFKRVDYPIKLRSKTDEEPRK